MHLIAVLSLLGVIIFYADASTIKQDNDLFPVVRTILGSLRGSVIKSRLGKSIYSFRGIRFAKPPIGNLRFQPPVPLEEWQGIQNVTEDGPACPQPLDGSDIPTSEDCLFLNVYTTKLPNGRSSPKRPVLVFFHPGTFCFFSGHSKVFGPQYFMDQNIVLVTTNYRLGALGFLNTGDEVLPGNYGMKDQVATLKWVKDNIAAFGGDPDSVTIGGYSAGSISVFLHMASPMSQGLFHRGIAMSASPFNEQFSRQDTLSLSKRQAAVVNCPTDTSQKIKDCLMQKDAHEFANSIFKLDFQEWGFDPVLTYAPVIEPVWSGERFLTADPIQLFLSGNFSKVPVLTGMTKDELSWMALRTTRNSSWAEDMENDFDRVAPIVFMYERNTERSHNISRTFKTFYFNDQPITAGNVSLQGLGKLYSDALVGFSEDRASKVISKVSSAPLYYYRFSYPGRYSHIYWPETEIPYGVVHHDDLMYLFHISMFFPYFNPGDPEIRTVERLTKIMANFIQTGNPTPEKSELLENVTWEPFSPTKLNYLDIGSNLEMKNGLYQDRMEVWEKLFPLPTLTNQYQSSGLNLTTTAPMGPMNFAPPSSSNLGTEHQGTFLVLFIFSVILTVFH